MFKAIGWILKIGFFSLLVLVAGNMVHWRGRTISDQIKTQLSHAERAPWAGQVRSWTSDVTNDARKGLHKRIRAFHPTSALYHSAERGAATERRETVAEKETRPDEGPMERIPSSERQKLRALIRELNSSYNN